ncbi:MAG: 16S rRNA (cytidine(1402)-2'-O)-methyltransferase [SAR324 cluster bacterium]|nr:16S rRNA (cytidine(1402)-2'-O)-methyltransferase [SAR324 cluster bacterium]
MAEVGKLYLVSTPIGNLQDISKRALSVLTEVDEVVCEEQRVGSTLMKRLGIDTPITLLNEHNETVQTAILLKSLKQGKILALISDAGTPVFADPGFELVSGAIRLKVSVIPVPGASSLMSALVCSGFSLNEFHFAGFLPRQTGARLDRLKSLREIRTLLIILETPYRLNALLKDLNKIFNNNTRSVLAMNLTQENEDFFRGTLVEMQKHFSLNPFKGEFVLMLDNQSDKKYRGKRSSFPKELDPYSRK